MQLDADACWSACRARDARFDGRFFVAVLTTGIYCRPICPAPTPRRENVRFYPSAAAAGVAGFRPCRRCRPESAPGLAGWEGTSASLARALRLIERDGAGRRGSAALASAVGIGERHLRRLFAMHLGASPAAVARTERLHLATKLLVETRLPISQVAAAAGFGSARRLRASFRRSYGAPPGHWRRGGDRRGAAGPGIELRLAFRPPLDWSGLLAFLAPRCTPGVEQVSGDVYSRTVRSGGRAGTLEARLADERHVLVRLDFAPASELLAIQRRFRRMFGLDADPLAVDAHLARDPLLAPLVVSHPGRRVPGAWDAYELAIRAVLGQQVSVCAATTFAGRIVARYGEPWPSATAGLTRLFPEPEVLAEADLSGVGVISRRAEAIRQVARAFREGRLTRDGDDAWRTDGWLEIPGIGDWTAQYLAMRAGGDADALPASDLALRKAVSRDGRPASATHVRERSKAWRPWRAYAAIHLWTRSPS
jgi:AraC family transcriptional regulator of adaptative response / DNA-3-methyladenine glycosylase II